MNDRCDVCGKKELLPYKCSYCGGTFCSEHRLPENHNCTGLKDYWNVPVKVKKTEAKPPKKNVRIPKITSYGVNNLVLITCTIMYFIAVLDRIAALRFLALNPLTFIIMPWQILTSIFLHIEFWHFFVNMFILFFFGSELERRVGGKEYLKIFLLSGIAGNIGYILFAYAYPLYKFIPALGASAAIFGIMGCLAIIAPEIRIIIFPIPIPIGIRTALILFAAYDFSMMLASAAGVAFTGIANIAHLAGLVFGVYYGRKIKRRHVYSY